MKIVSAPLQAGGGAEGADVVDDAIAGWSALLADADLATMGLTMRLRRLVRMLDREVASLIDASPLSTYGDYQLLAVLHRSREPLQPKEIAALLQVTRSGTSGRLDRLDELGLVRRDVHPDDARSALVTLTERGAELVVELMRAALDIEAAAFDHLGVDERSQLTAMLRATLLRLDDRASASIA